MTLVATVQDRLKTTVPALRNRVSAAADLMALLRENALPPVMPAAFVVPSGFDGGEPEAATHVFRQPRRDVISVVLVVSATDDPKAARALAPIDELIEATLRTLCGFAPDANAPGVLYALRGRLASFVSAALFYQIDFALQNQVRIVT